MYVLYTILQSISKYRVFISLSILSLKQKNNCYSFWFTHIKAASFSCVYNYGNFIKFQKYPFITIVKIGATEKMCIKSLNCTSL